jgi:hypothetical protein
VDSTTYDAPGRVTGRTLGSNAVLVQYDYYSWTNQGGRLEWLKSGITANPDSLQKLHYTYDAMGNVLSIQDYKMGNPYQTQTFTYDNLYRLISAQASGGTQGYYGPESYTYNTSTLSISGGAVRGVEAALLTVDGEEFSGTLAAVDPQAGVRVNDQTVKLDGIAELRFRTSASVGAKDKPRIRLRDGDVLHALVLSGDDKALRVQSALLGELSLKNDLLLGLVFPIKEPPSEEALAQFFGGANPNQDQLLTLDLM